MECVEDGRRDGMNECSECVVLLHTDERESKSDLYDCSNERAALRASVLSPPSSPLLRSSRQLISIKKTLLFRPVLRVRRPRSGWRDVVVLDVGKGDLRRVLARSRMIDLQLQALRIRIDDAEVRFVRRCAYGRRSTSSGLLLWARAAGRQSPASLLKADWLLSRK